MKLKLLLSLLALTMFIGCARKPEEAAPDPAWEEINRRYNAQLEAADRQNKKTDALQEQAERQNSRYEKLLQKWEEHSRRQEAVLDAMEKQFGVKR